MYYFIVIFDKLSATEYNYVMALLNETKITYYYGDYTVLSERWKASGSKSGSSRLYYVTDGEIEIEYGGAKTTVRAGEMALIPAGANLSYRLTDLNRATKYWFHFDMTVNGDRAFSGINFSPKIAVSDPDYVVGLFKTALDRSIYDTPAAKTAVAGAVAMLVAYYLENSGAVDSNGEFDAIDDAVAYIKANISETPTLKDLAATVHLSPNYFARKFRERMGVPPLKYVNMLKIELAKSLLENSDMPVGEIMTSTGFLDAAYFSKIFKSNTGHSPRVWRSIYGKKN